MRFEIEVKRHRLSVTQGEAEVIVNGVSIVRFGDDIVLNGEYDCFGGFGSNVPDDTFIESALRRYSNKIVNASERECLQ